MKFHTIYFLFLKVLFVVQFVLISLQKQSETSVFYLITDFIFKMSIGLFLVLYFYFNHLPGLYAWDKVVISFAGALLMFDAAYIVLPKVALHYGYIFNPFSLTDMFKVVLPKKFEEGSAR
jgi:hypothetical protein